MGFKTYAPTDEEMGFDDAYWYGEGEDVDPDFDEFGVRYPTDKDAPPVE